MPTDSKKKKNDKLYLSLDDDNSDEDPLDMSDINIDDSLLALEFQEVEDFKLGDAEDAEPEDLATKPSNLLQYAKELLEKTRTKPEKDTKSSEAKKESDKKVKTKDEEAEARFETQYKIIELMVEELENFGLDINVIQDIIKESQKFFNTGDIEAAETLIKNSKIFASNLWLEHRMNLISTLISFIDTFILNQTDLQLNFKNANKYFTQAQEFLAERDLTLANKYVDNTIQNVKKSWNAARKTKQREAMKYAKYWIKELEKHDVKVEELRSIIAQAEKGQSNNDFDETEVQLKKLMDISGEEIETIDIDLEKKEDFIQGIQGVYDIESFLILNDAISKAESMLLESQEKDKIQFQLNILLSAYKTVFDLENQDLEVTKLNEMFSNAKESFDKGDFETSGVYVKKIMALSKQLLGYEGEEMAGAEGETEGDDKDKAAKPDKKEKQKPPETPPRIDRNKLSPEKLEIFDTMRELKKEINFIKGLQKTGEDIVQMDELYSKLETAFINDSAKEVDGYLTELQKVIPELKEKYLSTKAKTLFESTFAMLSEAHELGIESKEAEVVLKAAEEHMKNGEFQTAIDEAVESQQMIERVMEKHQNASDKLLKTKMSLRNVFKNKKIPNELNGILELSEEALADESYDILDILTEFISGQIEQIKAGNEFDSGFVGEFQSNISIVADFQNSIAELSAKDDNTSELEEIRRNAIKALEEQNYKQAFEIIQKGEKIVGATGKSEELRRLRSELTIANEELKILENNNIDVGELNAQTEQFNAFLDAGDIQKAEELLGMINSEISNLKIHRKEVEEHIKELIKKLMDDISEAKAEQVDTKEAENLLNYATQRQKNGDFEEVEEILAKSREMLNNAMKIKLQQKAEERLAEARENLNMVPPNHARFDELNELLDSAKNELENFNFSATLENIDKFLEIRNEIGEISVEEKVETEVEENVEAEVEEKVETAEEPAVPVKTPTQAPMPKQLKLKQPSVQDTSKVPTIEPSDEEPTLAEAEPQVEPQGQLPSAQEQPPETGVPLPVTESEIPAEDEYATEPELETEAEVEPDSSPEPEPEPEPSPEPEPETESEVNQPPAPEPEEINELETGLDDKVEVQERLEPGPPEPAQAFSSQKAERLFKEAFGFVERERAGRYGDDLMEGDDVGEYGASGYDSQQTVQPRPSKLREKAYEEVRKERAQRRLRPPRTPTKAWHERIPPKDYLDEEYNSDYEEAMDEKYEPYELEDSRVDDEDYYMPPNQYKRSRDRQRIPYPRQTAEFEDTRGFDEEEYDDGLERRPRARTKRQVAKEPPRRMDRTAPEDYDFEPPAPMPELHRRAPRNAHERRMESLKKEAIKGLQVIQATITNTYNFGAQVQELEQLSEDAVNAFDSGDYQEVLLYVDQTEELSIRLKIAYMDSFVAKIQRSGENTDYLEYLINEAETAYNNERYKVGDEICRKFMMVIKELEIEKRTPRKSKIYCRYCGNSIPTDSTFCTVCGEKLW
ncbi:hypothetical protein [[Eubacterium] cellulosolvens]